MNTCKHCGVQTTKKVFCSFDCYNKYRADHLSSVARTCPVCGKIFSKTPYDIKRGKGVHCSAECQGNARKTKVTLTCIVCGSPFTVNPFKRDFQGAKYCSVKCKGLDRRTRETRTCRTCGKDFLVDPSRLKKGGGKFCSLKCFFETTEWYNRQSKPEIDFQNILDKNKIPYESHYLVYMYKLDFAIIAQKLAIEIDGFFHTIPARILVDEKRTEKLSSAGWTVYRIKADDIFDPAHIDWIKNFIRARTPRRITDR